MGKKYSVQMEDGKLVSVEVDGVKYTNPDEIPDDRDRLAVEELVTRMENGEDGFDPGLEQEFQSDLQELRRQSVRMPKVMAAIFGGIAVILLVISALSTVSTVNGLSREQSAPGRVVEMTLRTSRDSDTGNVNEYYYPVVEFAPSGRPARTVQLDEGSWPPAYEVGDEVTILYDPDRPNNARIKSGSSLVLAWILPGVTFIVGAAFAGAAFMVYKVFWPKPEEEAAAA